MMMSVEMRTVDKLSTQPPQVGFFMYYKKVPNIFIMLELWDEIYDSPGEIYDVIEF